jgi:RNA recognition motif-containing protein
LTKTNESSNIFVRKIPKDLKPMELEEMFSSFDPEKRRPVKSLKISRDADHSSRGYGFVCYENEEDAAKASAMLEESATRKECLAVRWNPRDRADARKLYNNLYVKNYPEEYDDVQLTALFLPYGNVGSLIQFEKPGLGKFAFICFIPADKNDHQYGPEAASKAIEALNGKDMGNGKTLYVKPALSASNRKAELLRETIKYKNSKKRCNLYVKNFDPKTTEENLQQLFSSNGQREIESIKMFPIDKAEKAYAFICFKTPDQAQSALQELNNQNINKRQLQICNYELKEFREIADEESKDKMGFQRFKEMNYQQRQWNDITSKDEFQYKLIELLKNLPQNQRGALYGGQMQQRQQMGGPRNNNYPRNNSAGRPQNRNMPYNNQNRGNSMDGNRHGGMVMGGAMPAPEGQIRPQGGMGGQQPQGPE